MSTGAWTPRFGGAVAVALLAVAVLAACDTGNDSNEEESLSASDATPTATVPPEAALGYWVLRRLNQGFVADCEQAKRPDDVGKQCARFRGERDGLLAYEVGPTFSDHTRILILARAGEGWTIAKLEERSPDDPPAAGIPWPLRLGATVVVGGTGDCLRVRERPGLAAPEVACLDDGAVVIISGGPVEIDDHEWWELEGWDGWSAGDWLRYPDDVPSGATPSPTP